MNKFWPEISVVFLSDDSSCVKFDTYRVRVLVKHKRKLFYNEFSLFFSQFFKSFPSFTPTESSITVKIIFVKKIYIKQKRNKQRNKL
jgi:hypothetical protein